MAVTTPNSSYPKLTIIPQHLSDVIPVIYHQAPPAMAVERNKPPAELSNNPAHMRQPITLGSEEPKNPSMEAKAPNPPRAPDGATQRADEPPAGVREAENAPSAAGDQSRLAEGEKQAFKAVTPAAGRPAALRKASESPEQGDISESGGECYGKIFKNNASQTDEIPCGPISSHQANNQPSPGPGSGPIIDSPSATFQQVQKFAPHQVVTWLDSQGYFIEFGTGPDVAILKGLFISKHMSGSALLDFGYELEWLLHSIPAAPSSRLIVIVKSLYRAAGIELPNKAPNLPQGRYHRIWRFVRRQNWIVPATAFAGTLNGAGVRLRDWPLERCPEIVRALINALYHFSYLWGVSLIFGWGASLLFHRIKEKYGSVDRLPERALEEGNFGLVQKY